MPMPLVEPRPDAEVDLRVTPPLLAHDASYLAASARIFSLAMSSMGSTGMTVSIDSIPGARSVAKADRKALARTCVPARHPKVLQRISEYGQMAKKLKAGDRVTWNTSQGKTSGTVQKKLTDARDVKAHHVAASRDNP